MKNNKPTCLGSGLIALDLIIDTENNVKNTFVGGSCGNVLTILSFLGWDSFPIARLAVNEATELIAKDFSKWGVHQDFLMKESTGSTPIIIQRNYTDKNGNPRHRFEFRCPETGKYLPQYKAVLAKTVQDLHISEKNCDFYYFDRAKRSSIEMAKICKLNGGTVYFEPTSMSDEKQFLESLDIADIVKFSDDRIKGYENNFPHFHKNKLEIITLGKNGLKYRYNTNNWINVPSVPIHKIVDTSGAGDWTSAFFINFLFENNIKISDNSSCDNTLLHHGLSYSQSMGALNCCFEGARGIMYEVENKEALYKYLEAFNDNNESQFVISNKHIESRVQICDLFEV